MTLQHPSARRLRRIAAGAALLLCAAPAALFAQAADLAAPRVYGLTPEQKAQAMDGQDRSRSTAAMADALGGVVDRGVHGEFGAMIGTGGARGIYGTAAVPIGDNAGAVVSFESTRYGKARYR